MQKIKEQEQPEHDNANDLKDIMQCSQQKNQFAKKGEIKKMKKVKVLKFTKIYQQLYDSDDEPTYIYFLMKIYKSYEQESYFYYRNYGFIDAKIAKIEYVQLDKKYETIDIYFDFFSLGVENFKKLIKMFKRKQDQKYLNLSIALKQYQMYLNNFFKNLVNLFSDKIKFSDEIQQRIDQAYPEFEQNVKQWASKELANELYEIELCLAKINLCKPTLKKKIYSKNLVLFLGSDLQGIYSKLIDLNLKDIIQNFLSGGEFNGELQLEKTIKILKWMIQDQFNQLTFQDEIFTIDGITIPTQKTIKYYSYDYQKKSIVEYHQFHFFYVILYNFEPNWIKYLIETRQNLQQIPKQIQYEANTNKTANQIQNNFEFICKQEYFLEKFNYVYQ
ncbi:hypothetical protein ABPG74_022084 [Tetrahymena malaccensis]